MWSPYGNPPQNLPLKRHHTARRYVHIVRESFTTQLSKLICAIILICLFVAGIISFILWLSLRPHRPRFYVNEFSLPALAQDTGFENAQISFNVTDRNPNHNIGIYYEAVNGSVYYRDHSVGATPLLFPFYQPPKNTTSMYGVLSGAKLTVNSRRWKEFTSDRATGTVVFRLEVTSMIRFKLSKWKSKSHRMHANCDVGVSRDGLILTTSKDKRCALYFR
ncbi:hypothetical protein HHK36_002085 [Tetracentron sinense]|uniref:Late embryogenesis abundant protein LEA-2 subgroup domain-containing protein n=1 Tax=Tetracentron sinense TaxID=13715 RepID=A0A834ZV58_TETSI|nr:hypothetical protein HHK36_002085 [Tetracentron sinense]